MAERFISRRKTSLFRSIGAAAVLEIAGCAMPPIPAAAENTPASYSVVFQQDANPGQMETVTNVGTANASFLNCDQRQVPDAEAIPPVTETPDSFALRIPILMYHRIIDPKDAGNSLPGLVVSPDVFKAQMRILYENGWHTITASELAKDLEHKITPPKKTFVITVDDGWFDSYTQVWPILQQFGFHATFYAISGRMSNPSYLSRQELKELTRKGNEIGNHTVGHRELTSGKIDYQIDRAAILIAKVTGKWPSTLAYPGGAYNKASINAVSRCEPLRMAVTTKHGVEETWANRFEVPRLRVNPDTSPKSLLRELTPYS